MSNVITLPSVQVGVPDVYASTVGSIIESAIIYGDLPDGFRLTEEEICQKMGVSRSPIREALKLLERDGLLVREPRRGVRVSPLTVEELDQLYVCRLPLEATVAQLVVKHASDAEIAGIREAHRDCERALAADDMRAHFAANVEMSERLFQAAHNQTLLRLLETIHKQALRYRFLAYQKSRDVRINSVRCNTELVKAFMERDAEAAQTKARESIESSHDVIKAALVERLSGKGQRAPGKRVRS